MAEPPDQLPSLPESVARPSLLTRWLLVTLALVSLLLGLIGLFLPVLPTVPFILLSAWAATRSSPRLLAWLERHSAFEPMLIEWRRGDVAAWCAGAPNGWPH